MPARDRNLYRGNYQTRRRALQQGLADGSIAPVCWRCGDGPRPDDPLEAGHRIDGDPTSPLDPEHRSCNARAGARNKRGDRIELPEGW